MTDSELRGIVLRRFYDRRLEHLVKLEEGDFDGRFSFVELQSICRQLAEKGLIEKWSPVMTAGGSVIGIGQITAEGVDVIEGNRQSPISITLDQRSTISVSSSQNVQIGSHNIQHIVVQLENLVKAIEASGGTDAEKAEAKSLLKKFLAHPLVSAIVGGLISGL
jgi:hypothetical protein